MSLANYKVKKPPQAATPRKPKINGSGLPHLLTRIFGQPLAIEERKMAVILHALGPRLGLSTEAIPVADMGPIEDGEDREYCVTEDGVAWLPVCGTLVNKAGGMNAMSGLTSYADIRETFEDAITDPAVKAIVFDFDSPGGEVGGMFDLSDLIYSSRGQKAMYAIANDDCYSAAYCLASACDKLFVTRTGGVGSVGCFMLHIDQSERDKQNGLKFTYIYSGDKKVEGNPHESLSAGASAEAQAEVDRIKDLFVKTVARNRGVPAQALIDTQAGCFYAENGLPLLADGVASFDEVMNEVASKISGPLDVAGALGRARSAVGTYVANMGGYGASMSLQPMAGPIAPHSTGTSDASWDGPANEARLKLNQNKAYYSRAYAWRDASGDETKKNSYRFIHHFVSADGTPGAASTVACSTGIGVLNGGRGGTTIPAADRPGVYRHLAKHLQDAGKEPPELKSEAGLIEDEQNRWGLNAILEPRINAVLEGMERDRRRLEKHLQSSVSSHVQLFPQMKASASANDRRIDLLVIPYETPSQDLGGFVEVYQQGCFEQGLSDDPRVCLNHNPDCVLGRKSANTATFWEEGDGVHVSCEAPETQWADDLLVSMRRGDITQASAAFWIVKSHYEYRASQKVRVIERAILREASVASFACYESTTASAQEPESLPVAATYQQQHEQLGARLQLLKST